MYFYFDYTSIKIAHISNDVFMLRIYKMENTLLIYVKEWDVLIEMIEIRVKVLL